MTNEAVIVELNRNANAIRFTVSDLVLVEKGTLMKLGTDPRIAVASGAGDVFAGVAATEKVASDTSTFLGLWVPGQNHIFDMKIAPGGSAVLGAMVHLSGANLIDAAIDTDYENGKVVGKALETGASNEVIQVLV